MLKNIKFLSRLTILEIKNLYSQNMLGIIWFFLNPILFFSAYYFFIIYMMGSNINNCGKLETFLFVAINLSLFFIFSNTLLNSCSQFSSSIELFRNTSYDPILFLLKYVIMSSLTYWPIILVSFLIKFIYIDLSFNIQLFLYIFLVCILESIFVFSLSLIFSCLIVIIKDLLNLLQIFTLCIMFISPIGFRAEKLYKCSKILYCINPLNYFLTPLRQIFMDNEAPNFSNMFTLSIFVLLFFLCSLKIFNTLKTTIVDYA